MALAEATGLSRSRSRPSSAGSEPRRTLTAVQLQEMAVITVKAVARFENSYIPLAWSRTISGHQDGRRVLAYSNTPII